MSEKSSELLPAGWTPHRLTDSEEDRELAFMLNATYQELYDYFSTNRTRNAFTRVDNFLELRRNSAVVPAVEENTVPTVVEVENNVPTVEVENNVPAVDVQNNVPAVKGKKKIPKVKRKKNIIPQVEVKKIPEVEVKKIPEVEVTVEDKKINPTVQEKKIPTVEVEKNVPRVEVKKKIPTVEAEKKIPTVEAEKKIPTVEAEKNVPTVKDQIKIEGKKIPTVEKNKEVSAVEENKEVSASAEETMGPALEEKKEVVDHQEAAVDALKKEFKMVFLNQLQIAGLDFNSLGLDIDELFGVELQTMVLQIRQNGRRTEFNDKPKDQDSDGTI